VLIIYVNGWAVQVLDGIGFIVMHENPNFAPVMRGALRWLFG
jgi:hypothetical protein